MKGSTICFVIITILYIASNLGLLFFTYKISKETETNPLSKDITDEDIIEFLNLEKKEKPISYYKREELKEKKNLRLLMDGEKCNEYREQIEKLIGEKNKNLNYVFDFDISFLNSMAIGFYYCLIITSILLLYFLMIHSLSSCCCEGFYCLFLPCYPFFICFIYLLFIYYFCLFITLVYQKYGGSTKDFEEFLFCPNVNYALLTQNYSDLLDLRKDLEYCLYIMIANFASYALLLRIGHAQIKEVPI